ncbi:MAG TPA: hypothetical protein VLM37_01165, partial [Fibrobacteraceae bacterium]|nr:hypothetical protein [Fibrobacteraceae bacterium]
YVRTENSPTQTITHLFSAVACVESRNRFQLILERVEKLLTQLQQRIRQRLSVTLPGDLEQVLEKLSDDDLTLAELAQRLDREQTPVDRQWLLHIHALQRQLLDMRKAFAEGSSGRGRASHGIVSQNAAGIYPWSPVTVPWAQNGNGEGVELARGIWEAHMARLCPEFIAIRKAELEIAGHYNPRIHDAFFAQFTWKQLNEEELSLCPPLVITGTDKDFYQKAGSLGDLFRTRAPVKILVFDTLQSNPCAPLQHLIAHDLFVLQASLHDKAHMLKGFAAGFQSARPALLQVLCPSVQDVQGFSDQATLSGVYPLFSGSSGNFSKTLDIHPDTYLEDNFRDGITFAELAAQDPRFSEFFTALHTHTGTRVAAYLQLDEDERLETIPVVERTEKEGHVESWLVSLGMLDRVHEFVRCKCLLRYLMRADESVAKEESVREEARRDLVHTLTQSLFSMAQG